MSGRGGGEGGDDDDKGDTDDVDGDEGVEDVEEDEEDDEEMKEGPLRCRAHPSKSFVSASGRSPRSVPALASFTGARRSPLA